jgi:hypothetical protein
MGRLNQVDRHALAAEINDVINRNLPNSQRCVCLGPTTASLLFFTLFFAHDIDTEIGKELRENEEIGKYIYNPITSQK